MATEDFTWEKKYPAYIVNRCLSYHYDTLIAANEMNGYHFSPKKYAISLFTKYSKKEKEICKIFESEKAKKFRVCKRVLWL